MMRRLTTIDIYVEVLVGAYHLIVDAEGDYYVEQDCHTSKQMLSLECIAKKLVKEDTYEKSKGGALSLIDDAVKEYGDRIHLRCSNNAMAV